MAEPINDWLARRRRGRLDIAKSRWVFTRNHDPVAFIINSISHEERLRLYCEITGKTIDSITTELATRKQKGGNFFALHWASINRVIAAHFRQLAWKGESESESEPEPIAC